MSDERPTAPDPFAYYQKLRRVKEYVEDNLAGDLSLGAAASVAGLDKKYFSTYFHERTGICYRDWIASLRVQRAKAMLQSANHSITRVALTVGFRDLRTFERTFKKHASMTARAYKRSVDPIADP